MHYATLGYYSFSYSITTTLTQFASELLCPHGLPRFKVIDQRFLQGSIPYAELPDAPAIVHGKSDAQVPAHPATRQPEQGAEAAGHDVGYAVRRDQPGGALLPAEYPRHVEKGGHLGGGDVGGGHLADVDRGEVEVGHAKEELAAQQLVYQEEAARVGAAGQGGAQDQAGADHHHVPAVLPFENGPGFLFGQNLGVVVRIVGDGAGLVKMVFSQDTSHAVGNVFIVSEYCTD